MLLYAKLCYTGARALESRENSISLQNGQERHTQTGRLERQTLLNQRYMILSTIGQGGMGAVYQAQDMKRKSMCAIKEMSLSMVPAEDRAQAIHNFETEATILSGLSHPNLPTFSGRFTEGSRHFLVMEYIDGITLEDYLESNHGPFSERRVMRWARQLCDVLAYLHNQPTPIIFRDLKPGNIMITRDGHIKLIDFGIARFFRQAGSYDTQLLGTPGYAPPEQYGKAQTDERSDIYSLAMTLFHLMTNTLSESGFGLKNVHQDFPQISLPVAKALEKATALSPEDRFQKVAAFRRALLGEGTFLFENGDQATSPEDLAELCARFPKEAADYLYAGEIELWLQEIGNTPLMRKAQRLRTVESDPEKAVELLLQAIMGPNARIRGRTATRNPADKASGTLHMVLPLGENGRGWFRRVPISDLVIQPREIDFGEVYPGVSEPLTLFINGNRGALVRGSIAASEPWILLDTSSFDGMSTRVNVRVNTAGLRGSAHYSGSIIIMPEEEDEEQDITIPVRVNVLNLSDNDGASAPTIAWGRPYTTPSHINGRVKATQTTSANGMSMAPPLTTSASTNAKTTNNPAQVNALHYNKARYNEYRTKYGPPGALKSAQASSQQSLWRQHGLTIFSAFMLASLFYVILSHIVATAHTPPLANSPLFVVALVSFVPLTTIGALVVNWNWHDALDRLCTGFTTALIILGLGELLWQTFLHAAFPLLQVISMLLLAALGATVGIYPALSRKLFSWLIPGLDFIFWLLVSAALAAGGLLGYCMTLGFSFSPFTLLGIGGGIVVASILVWRANYRLKHP
jgi:serine/threonine protein kinase